MHDIMMYIVTQYDCVAIVHWMCLLAMLCMFGIDKIFRYSIRELSAAEKSVKVLI